MTNKTDPRVLLRVTILDTIDSDGDRALRVQNSDAGINSFEESANVLYALLHHAAVVLKNIATGAPDVPARVRENPRAFLDFLYTKGADREFSPDPIRSMLDGLFGGAQNAE